MPEEKSTSKIIEDHATKHILKKIDMIRHHLELIEKNPTDFKYIRLVNKWIQEEAIIIDKFADVVLLSED